MKSIDKIIGKYLNEDFTPEAPGDMGSSDYDLMMQVIRAEEDTVYKYIALANQAKNPKVKKVLMDITQEERVHAHEMHILMKQLQSDIEKSAWTQAEKENKELSESVALRKMSKIFGDEEISANEKTKRAEELLQQYTAKRKER